MTDTGVSNGGDDLLATLDKIGATDVSVARLSTFKSEEDYNALCVELLVEVGK